MPLLNGDLWGGASRVYAGKTFLGVFGVCLGQTINATIPGPTGGQTPFAGRGPIYFLGLIHGHWNLPVTFEKSSQAEAVNMGISIVVPAHKIAEVLNHPELVEQRRQQDELVAKDLGSRAGKLQ
jgi:hypothetical protein